MTKRFCDLCEKPVANNCPQFSQDGCANAYGKKVRVRAVFEVVWTSSTGAGPLDHTDPVDLCASCQAKLLRNLRDKILPPTILEPNKE